MKLYIQEPESGTEARLILDHDGQVVVEGFSLDRASEILAHVRRAVGGDGKDPLSRIASCFEAMVTWETSRPRHDFDERIKDLERKLQVSEFRRCVNPSDLRVLGPEGLRTLESLPWEAHELRLRDLLDIVREV
jgi:hypothetical protein